MSVTSQIDRLNAVKDRIRTNLVAQGVTVPSDTMLEEMATMILSVAGYTPQKGIDYFDGKDGKTPVKGVDFWTATDQESIVQDVIAALGTPVFGRVDADNNIILTGELADGTYTIKYEDAEGEQTVIGTLNHTVVPEPTYTNQIPISTDTDGTVFNGKGYAGNSRFNSSGAVTSGNYYVTGFIPFTNGSVIRSSKGMFDATDSGGYPRVAMYDNNKAYVTDWRITPSNLSSKSDEVTVNADGELWFNLDVANVSGAATANSIKYARICASHIDDSSVITINEEIV